MISIVVILNDDETVGLLVTRFLKANGGPLGSDGTYVSLRFRLIQDGR